MSCSPSAVRSNEEVRLPTEAQAVLLRWPLRRTLRCAGDPTKCDKLRCVARLQPPRGGRWRSRKVCARTHCCYCVLSLRLRSPSIFVRILRMFTAVGVIGRSQDTRCARASRSPTCHCRTRSVTGVAIFICGSTTPFEELEAKVSPEASVCSCTVVSDDAVVSRARAHRTLSAPAKSTRRACASFPSLMRRSPLRKYGYSCEL